MDATSDKGSMHPAYNGYDLCSNDNVHGYLASITTGTSILSFHDSREPFELVGFSIARSQLLSSPAKNTYVAYFSFEEKRPAQTTNTKRSDRSFDNRLLRL